MSNFDQAFQRLLGIEQGFTNNPNDSGGATKFGVTAAMLAIYRKVPQVTVQDVQNLTVDEAKLVYKSQFWDPLRLDVVNSFPVAYAIFDQSVNGGQVTAAKRVQATISELGTTVKIDGLIGAITIGAVNLAKPPEFLLKFCEMSQLAYLQIATDNPKDLVFLKGWITRTHKILDLIAEYHL